MFWHYLTLHKRNERKCTNRDLRYILSLSPITFSTFYSMLNVKRPCAMCTPIIFDFQFGCCCLSIVFIAIVRTIQQPIVIQYVNLRKLPILFCRYETL